MEYVHKVRRSLRYSQPHYIQYTITRGRGTGAIGGNYPPPPTFRTKGKCALFLKGKCPFSSVPFLDCAPTFEVLPLPLTIMTVTCCRWVYIRPRA